MSTATASEVSQNVRPGKPLSFYLLLAVVVVSGAYLAIIYPSLPDTVASQFDMAGHPRSWMPKSGFAVIFVVVCASTAAIFLALPWMLAWLPVAWINLPKKEYWLAPERRESTRRQLGASLCRFGLITQLFLSAVFYDVIQVNLAHQGQLASWFIWALCAYLGYSVWWTVGLMPRYGKIPD